MFEILTQKEREKIMRKNDMENVKEVVKEGLFKFKTISLENLQEIFDTRINGRGVTVGYENRNVRIPITFDNIEMNSYQNGECHLCEEDFPDAPYALVFNVSEVQNIKLDDYIRFFDQTGGQVFIHFKNGDCLELLADF